MMNRIVIGALLGVALIAAEVHAATRHYAVTWNEATSQWVLDDDVAPELTFSVELAYEFALTEAPTAGGKFWLSMSDNFNDTSSMLTVADGVTNNNCAPPCTMTFTPADGDAGQTFYYLSELVQNAGNTILVTKCSTLTETECGNVDGCGWRTECITCSSLTDADACGEADTCSWCVDPTAACVASTDTTCASFAASDEGNAQLLYLLFLLLIPIVGAAAVAATFFVKKANYKKRNDAMFRMEDESSVLGGRPAADDNTL